MGNNDKYIKPVIYPKKILRKTNYVQPKPVENNVATIESNESEQSILVESHRINATAVKMYIEKECGRCVLTNFMIGYYIDK